MKCILHRHFLAEVSAAQWVGILPYHTKLGLLDSQREPLPVFSECSTCVEAVFNQGNEHNVQGTESVSATPSYHQREMGIQEPEFHGCARSENVEYHNHLHWG